MTVIGSVRSMAGAHPLPGDRALAARRGAGLGRDARRRGRSERDHGRPGRDGVRLRPAAPALRHRAGPVPGPGDDRPAGAGHRQGPRRAGPGPLRAALGGGLGRWAWPSSTSWPTWPSSPASPWGRRSSAFRRRWPSSGRWRCTPAMVLTGGYSVLRAAGPGALAGAVQLRRPGGRRPTRTWATWSRT